jgi:hypothetical protein
MVPPERLGRNVLSPCDLVGRAIDSFRLVRQVVTGLSLSARKAAIAPSRRAAPADPVPRYNGRGNDQAPAIYEVLTLSPRPRQQVARSRFDGCGNPDLERGPTRVDGRLASVPSAVATRSSKATPLGEKRRVDAGWGRWMRADHLTDATSRR